MEPETNQPSSAPQLCRSGCGFYGNSSTDGLCSKCYKDPAVTKQSDNIVSNMMTTSSNGNYDKMQSLGTNETMNSDQINEVLNLLSNSSKSSLLKNHNIDLTGNTKMSFHSLDQNSLHAHVRDSTPDTRDKAVDISSSSPELDKKSDHIFKSQSSSRNSSNSLNVVDNLESVQSRTLGSDIILPSSSSTSLSSPETAKNSLETNSNPDELKAEMDTGEPLTSYSLGNSPTLSHKNKPNRCHFCRKKIGISGFPCRCGASFCSIHRYSDKHNCTFDYRELAQSEIRKNNPIVQAQKIQKI